jgi:hypothetical protein
MRCQYRVGYDTAVSQAEGSMSEFKTFTFSGPAAHKGPGVDGWLSEDDVKERVRVWLERSGWRVEVAWGKSRGTDILAVRDDIRWLIEAKGGGSLQPMRVNYFLMVLGEVLQRMEDPATRYSIALPDMRQFRGLWARLPSLAKKLLGISALFIDENGAVEEAEA